MIPTPPSFVDLENARVDEQRRVMQNIITAGHCPFCMEHFQKYHKGQIVRETTHWVLTPNQWPYDHTRVHYLAILKTHAEHLAELPAGAGEELLQLFAWAEKEIGARGGGIAMRFGDTRYSAGTVRHLHGMFIVPDVDAPDFQPVRVKIGKN